MAVDTQQLSLSDTDDLFFGTYEVNEGSGKYDRFYIEMKINRRTGAFKDMTGRTNPDLRARQMVDLNAKVEGDCRKDENQQQQKF